MKILFLVICTRFGMISSIEGKELLGRHFQRFDCRVILVDMVDFVG